MSSIAQILRLLGDETRLRILILVSQTPLNVSELTTILGMAQSGISRHLSHLRKMNLLQERKEGIWTFYQLAQKESLESELHLLWNYLQEQLSTMKDPKNDRVRLHEVLRQREISGGGLNERLLEPGQSWFAWSCLLGILLRQNSDLEHDRFGFGSQGLSFGRHGASTLAALGGQQDKELSVRVREGIRSRSLPRSVFCPVPCTAGWFTLHKHEDQSIFNIQLCVSIRFGTDFAISPQPQVAQRTLHSHVCLLVRRASVRDPTATSIAINKRISRKITLMALIS